MREAGADGAAGLRGLGTRDSGGLGRFSLGERVLQTEVSAPVMPSISVTGGSCALVEATKPGRSKLPCSMSQRSG